MTLVGAMPIQELARLFVCSGVDGRLHVTFLYFGIISRLTEVFFDKVLR